MNNYSDKSFIRISPMEEKLKSFFSATMVYSDKPYGGKIEIPFFGYDRLFG